MRLESLFVRASLLVFVATVLLFCATRASAQVADSTAAPALQTSAVPARITQAIDETQRATLKGNVHPLARPEFDQGPVGDSTPMNRMMLFLQRSPQQEAALQTLLGEQQTKDSPNFHKWLTPQQFGAQFGPADADIQTVTDWLTHKGFQAIKVAAGRTVIEFSGTAGQVRNAFHTGIHYYFVNGETRQANSKDPQIPAALRPVVAGVVTLHNFPRRSMRHDAGVFVRTKEGVARAQFTTTSGCGSGQAQPCFVVGPADFSKIYNVPSALTGSGVAIALVADSNINPQDVTDFRNLFGLPANPPNIVLNGPDPGISGPTGDEGEADLDTQVAGMVAPAASINLVVSEGTLTANGIDLSAIYIIDNNMADVISVSFGICEAGLGTAGNQFYNAIWEQAAAQGISVMVSAGDNGSAGCDDFLTAKAATQGLAVSGIASTPFNVAVGGTDFDDAGTQTSGGFWSANNSTDGLKESAQGYIHEIPWNDSCAATATSSTLNTVCATANGISAGSGGPSSVYAKTLAPWQNGVTPADNTRDLPDVSLFASDGPASDSFYLLCEADGITSGPPSCAPDAQGHFSFFGAGGTSASSPAFAGIMALINQQQGGRQGNPNPVLYKIAATATNSCNSSTQPVSPASTTCVFYDITKGNNSVPCAGASPNCSSTTAANGVLVSPSSTTTPAWTTGTGYDLATGLGTVNVTNLAAAWKKAVGAFNSTSTATKINGLTTLVAITHGQSANLTATVTSTGGTPTGDVSFLAPTSVNGGAANSPLLGLGPATLSSGTATLATTSLPGGTYTLKAHYAGDGTFAPSDDPTGVPVVVNKENSKLQVGIVAFDANGNVTSTNATSFAYGSPYILRMDILNSAGTATNCQPVTATTQAQIAGCALDATGTVTVTDGGAPLDGGTFGVNSQGHAEDQPIQLSPGTHNISAAYSGDISYSAPPAPSPLTLTVSKAATATSVTPSLSSITAGTSVTLTATVATNSNGAGPTGTVQFKNGATALGSPANCTPMAASNTAAASCTATLTTTLSLIAAPRDPSRNVPYEPWGILALTLAVFVLLTLRRTQAPRRAFAYVTMLLLVGLAAALAGCGGYGGGNVRYDSITAVYSGDSNYSGSTSPAFQITIQ